ncbi:phosphatase PAP2 family protein [Kitasatospora sp. NPDC051914]|uniref:phosphatase PAP2 family protein n=1 Tax=Kitasatospora sp. NPDC051914 TaxID=3154945 RepID=UPI003419086A
MGAVTAVARCERCLSHRLAAVRVPWLRAVLDAVGRAARFTGLWWAISVVLAVRGGPRGRRAAAEALASVAVAEAGSALVAKRLVHRRRPPPEWAPGGHGHDRPDSSSFPSAHTAAAVAYTTARARTLPAVGAACAAAAVLVSMQRVTSAAHWAGDVAAGAVIGAVAARAVHVTARRLGEHGRVGVNR